MTIRLSRQRIVSGNPFHAVVAGDRHGFQRRINSEERPWAGNKWVFFNHAFVDVYSEAGRFGNGQFPTVYLERFAQNFFSKWPGIHDRTAGPGVNGILEPLNDVSRPADAEVRGGE